MTTWLLKLGANIVGISKDIPTSPSMFKELKLENKIKHYKEDIRDLSKITDIISKEKPEFLFHLAAQPIVASSYTNPIETISSNTIGTANILEALRLSNHKCTAIIITSDKVYDNIEQVEGYKEDDEIGGKDVYSSSKGAAELIIKSYYHSFFKKEDCNIKFAIARAGNVIGGGDWAKDRIVVDCVKAWSIGKAVEIRSPKATRPWQHVLEPISGYLNLGLKLYEDSSLNGEKLNFGPKTEKNYTVEELLTDLSKYWGLDDLKDVYKITNNVPFSEAKLLKLNSENAFIFLKWQANLDYKDSIKFTGEWYFNFYKKNENLLDITLEQIAEYENIARKKGLKWTE